MPDVSGSLLYFLPARWRDTEGMGGNSVAFELNITVEPGDIDQFGHVNNIIYLRWVQDVAAAHWTTVVPPSDREKFQWVVVCHEIDYKQAAFLGDEIIARTWVGNARRIRFERHTEILRARDRTVLAKAVTLWCPIDIDTGQITVVSAELKALFRYESPDP